MRSAMREIEPTLPVFGLRPLDELLDQSLTNERIMLRLLCVFADIGLLLGLYGVLKLHRVAAHS